MQSVTSYYNKGIFIKNIKRFWVIWGAYLAGLVLMMPVRFALGADDLRLKLKFYGWVSEPEVLVSEVIRFAGSQGVLIAMMFMAIAIGVCLFAYLHNDKSAAFFHSLPVTRKSLYGTNVLTGLLMLLAPALLVQGIVMMQVAAYGWGDALPALWMACLQIVLYGLLFLGLAVVCGMLTGNVISHVALYGGLLLLHEYISSIMQTFMREIVFGYLPHYNGAPTVWLSPYEFLRNRYMSPEQQRLGAIVFGIVGILFLLLSYWLYKRRRLEMAGEMVAIPAMKPVARVVIAFCAALPLSVILHQVLFASDESWQLRLGLFVISSFVTYFLARMAVDKTVRVFHAKALIGATLCAVVATCLGLGITAYYAHWEQQVPNFEEIEWAQVDRNDAYTAGEYNWRPKLTDPSNITKVIELHRAMIEQRTFIMDTFEKPRFVTEEEAYEHPELQAFVGNSISIVYKLKNGEFFIRDYTISQLTRNSPLDAIIKKTAEIYNTPENLLQEFGVQAGHRPYNTAVYTTFASPTQSNVTNFDAQHVPAIEAAIIADIHAGNIRNQGADIIVDNKNNMPSNTLQFLFKNDGTVDGEKKDAIQYESGRIMISEQTVHINQALAQAMAQ